MTAGRYHENGPRIIVRSDSGEEFVATRENSALFTFIGRAAIYDHAYIQHVDGDGSVSDIFVFRELANEQYKLLRAGIEKYYFRQHRNMSYVSLGDQEAFSICVKQVIERDLRELFGQ